MRCSARCTALRKGGKALKILYGVVGEGMGHAIRSRVIVERLLEWGHEVEIVVSGRAHDYLQERFDGVSQIWGLTMSLKDNKVDRLGTTLGILKGAVSGWPENVRRYFELTSRFSPDVVVSDFETWSTWYGHRKNLPIICLDNIQAVRRCWHPPEILRGRKADWRIAKGTIKAKIPTADHYLISTFFQAPLKYEKTTLVPPILRPELFSLTPSRQDHVLVYQTSETFAELPHILQQFDIPFRIYGLRRNIQAPVTEGNLTFCPFGEQTFIDDLATSRGVIASAGFTLITEALHLGKPYLATPVGGQFEQVMNARYIEYMGYGTQDETLHEFSVRAFLEHLDEYAQKLEQYPRQNNEATFAQLQYQLQKASPPGAG